MPGPRTMPPSNLRALEASQTQSPERHFYVADNKKRTKIQTIFRFVNLAFLQLYCPQFSFKLANISKSYEENKTVLIILFTLYM